VPVCQRQNRQSLNPTIAADRLLHFDLSLQALTFATTDPGIPIVISVWWAKSIRHNRHHWQMALTKEAAEHLGTGGRA
jgi:hypothetical protein